MIFEDVTLAQLNNNILFSNANAPDVAVFGYRGANDGSFDNVQPGTDYLVVTNPFNHTNTGSTLAVGTRIPIYATGHIGNPGRVTVSVDTAHIGGNAMNWQDALYNANAPGGNRAAGNALSGAHYTDTTWTTNVAVTDVDLQLHPDGNILPGDTIAFSNTENPAFTGAGGLQPAGQVSTAHWTHRRILTVDRDVGNNRTRVRVLRLANTAPNVGPVASTVTGVAYARGYVVRRNAHFEIRRPSMENSNDTHVNFSVSIPNIIGYPEHKRCLMQVQQAWFYAGDHFSLVSKHGSTGSDQQTPPLVGVEILGIGPQNTFSTNVGRSNKELITNLTATPKGMGNATLIGYGMIEPIGLNRYVGSGNDISRNQRIAYGFKNFRSVIDDGVLCGTPFGKVIRVRFVNMTTGETLTSATGMNDDLDDNTSNTIENNPSHVVLRMLFIDGDEVPDR